MMNGNLFYLLYIVGSCLTIFFEAENIVRWVPLTKREKIWYVIFIILSYVVWPIIWLYNLYTHTRWTLLWWIGRREQEQDYNELQEQEQEDNESFQGIKGIKDFLDNLDSDQQEKIVSFLGKILRSEQIYQLTLILDEENHDK